MPINNFLENSIFLLLSGLRRTNPQAISGDIAFQKIFILKINSNSASLVYKS